MEEKGVDGDMPYLPQEIILNILKRLPGKTLIRFQRVCREWINLFKSQSFVADHLNHSNNQNPLLLVQPYSRPSLHVKSNDMHAPWNLYCIDSEMQLLEFQNPPSPLLDYFKYGRIVGSSNGLLCVHQKKVLDVSRHFLLVWNPSIREVILVPEIKFHVNYDDYYIGFGFNSIINDYKIVCFFMYCDKISTVRVYSLISGSWKKVKFRHTAVVTSVSVTVNGVMFWFGSTRRGWMDEDDVIVSFDLAKEVFTLITIHELHPCQTLKVYEEKLAIVCSITSSEDSAKNLWVMEEGAGASGERWSWTKKYINLPDRLHHEIIYRNEIVCWAEREDQNDIASWDETEDEKEIIRRDEMEDEPTIVLFNPTTKQIKKFPINLTWDFEDHFFFNYVESIIPVGGMKSIISTR